MNDFNQEKLNKKSYQVDNQHWQSSPISIQEGQIGFDV